MKNFDRTKNYLGVYKVENPQRFGIVEISEGRIINVEEKPERPKTNLAICGIYYIRNIKKLFNALENIERRGKRTKGEFQLTDALFILIKEKEKFYPLKVKKWYDTGTLEEILNTHKIFLGRKSKIKKTVKMENSRIIHPVWIDSNVHLKGCKIGPFVSIERNSIIINSIIKNSIIYKNSVIEGVEIKKGIIGDCSVIKGGNFKEIFITNNTKIIS